MTIDQEHAEAKVISKTEMSYDDVPYLSQSFPDSHPANLSAIGAMFGINCPDFTHGRILEIGCGTGDNLLPIALHNPGSYCVGIDLSAIQVKQGKAFSERFNLNNFELRAMNIMEFDSSMGKFDYIICHGVFSWVPGIVQQKILDVCRDHLSENGIAYISYNVYPGWHIKEISRNLMYRSCHHIDDPKLKLETALMTLDTFSKHVDDTHGTPFKKILESEREFLRKHDDSYILHEYLEETNTPFYFRDFVSLANQHSMLYLADVELKGMFVDNCPTEVQQLINGISKQRFDTEEYIDFLRGRKFRKSLLVGQNTAFDLNINIDRMANLFIRSNICSGEYKDSQVFDDSMMEFSVDEKEGSVKSSSVLNKIALLLLENRYPQYVEISDLLNLCYLELNTDTSKLDDVSIMNDLKELGVIILLLLKNGLVDIKNRPLSFMVHPNECPRGYFLAREQIKNKAKTVTSLLHKVTQVREEFRPLFLAMDGKNSIEDLMEYIPEILESMDFEHILNANRKLNESQKHLLVLTEILKDFCDSALLEP